MNFFCILRLQIESMHICTQAPWKVHYMCCSLLNWSFYWNSVKEEMQSFQKSCQNMCKIHKESWYMTLETTHPQLEYKRLSGWELEGTLVGNVFRESCWSLWVSFSKQMKKLKRENRVLFDCVQCNEMGTNRAQNKTKQNSNNKTNQKKQQQQHLRSTFVLVGDKDEETNRQMKNTWWIRIMQVIWVKETTGERPVKVRV